MVTQPAYLKNLKAFTRAQLGVSTDPKLAVQNVTGESDRGAVILAATSIEDMLEWAILARMPGLLKDSSFRDTFFGVNGPAGTFSSKITMAYAMGIIDAPMRKLLDLIREMRNCCAHARQEVTFSTPELAAICKVVLAEGLSLMKDQNKAEALRHLFVLKCTLICQELAGGRKTDMVKEIHDAVEARNRLAAAMSS